jgi:hypothetical protein
VKLEIARDVGRRDQARILGQVENAVFAERLYFRLPVEVEDGRLY